MLVHVQNLNVYTFIARSLEDKDKWISAIGEAIDNAFPNQRHDSTHEAVMHTFEAPNTNCAYCGKLLKGLFYQGKIGSSFYIHILNSTCIIKINPFKIFPLKLP